MHTNTSTHRSASTDAALPSVTSKPEQSVSLVDQLRINLNAAMFSNTNNCSPENNLSEPTSIKSSLTQSWSWAKLAGIKLLTERIALKVCEQGLPLAAAWLTSQLVPAAIEASSTGNKFSTLLGILSGIAVVGVASTAISVRRGYLDTKAMFRTFHVLHRRIMEAGIDLSSSLLEEIGVQNKITKLRENVQSLQNNVNALVNGAAEIATLALTAISIIPISPPIAGMVSLLGVWRVLQARQLGRERNIAEDTIAEPRRQMWYSSWAVRDSEGLQGIKHLLKANQLVDYSIKQMREIDDTVMVVEERAAKRAAKIDLALLATMTFASAYGLFRYISGDFGLASALYLTAASGLFSSKMNSFSNTIGQWVATKPFVDEAITLFKIGDQTRKSERELPASEVKRYSTAPRLVVDKASVSVKSKNISDDKPSERLIIKDISIDIAPGEFLAIVGKTGAGKTTLVKLLLGTKNPSSGVVTINEQNIINIPLAELRANTSYLPQSFWNYQGRSIEYNVSLGNPIWDLGQDISSAIKDSGLREVMNTNGFDQETVIGAEFRNGRALSGGEWQLVALARALAKNGKLIILDEPTSRLDVDTAKTVTKHIRDLNDHTRLLVTHDIGLAKNCDRIVVMSKENPDDDNSPGVVEAIGTHEELMQVSPTYKRFYLTQAGRFDNTTK